MDGLKLLEPITVGRLRLRNRIVMPPMGTDYALPDGSPSPRHFSYLVARARGGVGLILCEGARVNRAVASPGRFHLHNDTLIPCFRSLTEAVHTHGAKIGIQLGHPGRQTTSAAMGGLQPVAPSPIPCPVCREMPHELTREEIKALVEDFAQAAQRAQRAGFDLVELHGAHGYLISQFFSPHTNQRRDEYGGDVAGRCRFAVEIVRRIKERLGSGFPVAVRFNGSDFMAGGLTLEESKVIARLLQAAGVDLLDISAGVYGSYPASIPPYFEPPGWRLFLAQGIKETVRIPVVAAGRLVDPLLAEKALRQGAVDLVALGRALIADPELPIKLARGEYEAIRKCIGCNEGCIDRINESILPSQKDEDHSLTCLVNPEVGWEEAMSLTPTFNPKRVVVVGGGPAGLETARVAALRGHRVTLYEERPELGGQMLLAARPPGKREFIEAIRYLEQEVTRLGVSVALGRSATAAEVMGRHPQAVVIATGALPLRPPFPGADSPGVSTAWEVLEGKAPAGEKIIVIGGGSVGLETAHFLAAQGKRVTVVEMLPHWGADMGRITRWYLRQRLEELGVELVRSTRVEEIKGHRVKVTREGKEETLGDFDTVALAMGVRPRRELAGEIKGQVPELHIIGDALKPRRALEAIADGARVGRLI